MGDVFASLVALLAGVGVIVWGAEAFAEQLASAAARLKISSFALALLLAGAEPEELATAVAATMRGAPAIAFGDVIGANVAICLIALGVGAVLAPIPFGRRVLRYAVLGLPAGCVSVAASWDGRVGRFEGALLVLSYVGYVAAIWIAERQPPTLGETAELVGSFAYNATMTLGAAAGVRPTSDRGRRSRAHAGARDARRSRLADRARWQGSPPGTSLRSGAAECLPLVHQRLSGRHATSPSGLATALTLLATDPALVTCDRRLALAAVSAALAVAPGDP